MNIEKEIGKYSGLIKGCQVLAEIDANKYIKAKPKNITKEQWEYDIYTEHILNFIALNNATLKLSNDVVIEMMNKRGIDMGFDINRIPSWLMIIAVLALLYFLMKRKKK